MHGNQITNLNSTNNNNGGIVGGGFCNLRELKVLNLAGNQLRQLNEHDLRGLINLDELNLRRNKLKKLHCFGETPKLQKLHLSNNDIVR